MKNSGNQSQRYGRNCRCAALADPFHAVPRRPFRKRNSKFKDGPRPPFNDRRFLMESILNPSASIAAGFGAISVTFKDQTTLGGLLEGDGPDHLDIAAGDKVWRVKKSDLAEVPVAISPMPPMEHGISPREVRDLVAWLATLTEEPQDPAAKPAPQPYVPGSTSAGMGG